MGNCRGRHISGWSPCNVSKRHVDKSSKHVYLVMENFIIDNG